MAQPGSLADTFVNAALQQNASNEDKNPGSGFAVGAQIAHANQQLQIQRQQMEQKQQELTMEKYSRVGQAWEVAAKIPAGPLQQAYVQKALPTITTGLGMDSNISPDVMAMMQKEPQIASVAMAGVISGKYDPGILQDQTLYAKTYPELAQQFSAAEMSRTMTDRNPEMMKAYQENLQRQSAQKVAGMKIEAARVKTDANISRDASKEEQNFRNKISDKVDADFKPLMDAKSHINSALNAGDRVADDLTAGKTPSSSDQTLLATGLATTINKRINPTEFQNIMHEKGAESWTVDQWQKYISGGANPQVIKALMNAAESQNAQLDEQINANKSRIESQVKTSKWSDKADSILSPLKATIDSLPVRNATTVKFNDHIWPRAELQKIVDADPQGLNPKTADAKKALAGGK